MQTIVIGAGAAGLMAAGTAAANGAQVTVLEKNNRPGKKLLITGKGRCNITNTAGLTEFISALPGNGQFLYSALTQFSNQALVEFFTHLGLETKIERGGRVFPVSDRAADVVDTLVKYCLSKGVKFIYEAEARELVAVNETISGVILKDGRELACQSVILATGGASYPLTGSTGDGYSMARKLGHSIVTLKPALVPLETKEVWVQELQGLSLKNVEVSAWQKEKKVVSDFGEMLFTHFGLSGPVILSLSRSIVPLLGREHPVKIKINLKPALTQEQLDSRLQRDFAKTIKKQFQNSLNELLPKSLIPVIIGLSGIPAEKLVHQITREERLGLTVLLQALTITVKSPRPLKEAIVTAGGVSVKEINPKTMQSKLIKGLFLVGEVVDVDGYTGGFNLQAAFSMGYLAGFSSSEL